MTQLRKLWLEGPAGRLEAMLRLASPARAVAVIAHPHPLHGGSLHHPVVFHADRALHDQGLTSLRFNFRGVGSSDGTHDAGRGEIEDLAAAVRWTQGVCDATRVLVVGYSFGSRVGLDFALSEPQVSAFVGVGVPVRKYSFADLAQLGRPFGVVQADNDEFGLPTELAPILAAGVPPGELRVVEGCDHLFSGRAREVGDAVAQVALRALGLEPIPATP